MQDCKDTNEEDSAPTVEEVEVAVQKLKNYKAPRNRQYTSGII